MRVAICYIFPTALAAKYVPLARRFVESYMDHPPGSTDHDIYVSVNGGIEMGEWNKKIFEPLPCQFFQHNNYGKDIGAFRVAADQIPCDLLVCMGSHIHFHRDGWLDRMVMAYEENGPTVYGPWGFQSPRPHLRTTAFWLPPELLLAHPLKVSDRERYQFEHGSDSITLWCQKQGLEPIMVTWDGCYQMPEWHPVDRKSSLFIDQHMERDRP